jgi:chemotaxis protein methyltransferase CheR
MSSASETLRGFVRTRAGISIGADKEYLLRARLEPQLKHWGMNNLDGLASHLTTNPGGKIANEVVAALTINETLWFRDGKPFDHIKNVVLPDILTRSGDRNLTVWSAACSSGQEVYSIAMTLKESNITARNWTWSILGSDICEPVLERARAGVYSKFEVQRGLPIQRLVQYFEQLGQDYTVRKELRQNISFRSLNLTDLPLGIGPFDLVFCRNVLIYFEVDVKSKVLASIAKRMKPGGYLILGSAETTMGISKLYSPVPGASGLYRLSN